MRHCYCYVNVENLFIYLFISLGIVRSHLYRQQEEYLRRTLDYSEDSTQPASANSSVCEGPTSPLIVDNTLSSMEADAKHSQEVESLKRLLQEVRPSKCIMHKTMQINKIVMFLSVRLKAIFS